MALKMTDRFDVRHCDELIDAEAEKFIAVFENIFSEHMKKIFQWRRRKKKVIWTVRMV